MNARTSGLGWLGILRLGLVQTSLGAIVVLTTSTLNRVMVVELALPALLPGILVAIHYLVQISRPRFGHGSDNGGRRTPWIIGGIAVLGAGGVLAAVATGVMATSEIAGIALALTAFLAIGIGVGASGTCLLVLLASMVAPERRAAAATITWIMMIAGFAITAGIAGAFLVLVRPPRRGNCNGIGHRSRCDGRGPLGSGEEGRCRTVRCRKTGALAQRLHGGAA
jgi:BCD family chlorophyll transporter-like MFS transporter